MTTIEYIVGCAIDGGKEVELPVISLLDLLTEGMVAIAFSACACLSALLVLPGVAEGPLDSGVCIEDIVDAPITLETD